MSNNKIVISNDCEQEVQPGFVAASVRTRLAKLLDPLDRLGLKPEGVSPPR